MADGWLLVLILVASAVAAWTVMESVENTAYMRAKLDDPTLTKSKLLLWWSPLLSLLGLIIGFGVGAFCGALTERWAYGAMVGLCGGGLHRVIVSSAKGQIRNVSKGLVSKLLGSAPKDDAAGDDPEK